MGLLSRLLGRTAKKAWPDFGSFDDVTRLPVNATREIGAGGLPVSPSQPFRNSLRGGSDDLMEAARPKGLLSRALSETSDAGRVGAGFRRMGNIGYASNQFMRGNARNPFPDEGISLDGVTPTKERVRISSLTPTQLRVSDNFMDPNRPRNETWLMGDFPVVYRNGRDLYVLDGHNRLSAAAARGEADMEVLVFDARNGARPAPMEEATFVPATDWTQVNRVSAAGVASQHGLDEAAAIALVRRARQGERQSDRQRQIIRDMIAADRADAGEPGALANYLRGNEHVPQAPDGGA